MPLVGPRTKGSVWRKISRQPRRDVFGALLSTPWTPAELGSIPVIQSDLSCSPPTGVPLSSGCRMHNNLAIQLKLMRPISRPLSLQIDIEQHDYRET
ncbi:hypothetical protein CDAR_557261 [Caerostris darwini]|uniref:Uncharacterized protein n=1 Tax=Caerostris darwini TaxID=1538125 RepID=A0AAV4P3S7_9ARAC|nr:hypothetical protein CDAR_557261 [Caerostris darwini]